MAYEDIRLWSITFAVTGLDSAAEIYEGYLPAGYKGQFLGATFYATTATTGAAVLVEVGTAADADAYGEASIAITAINTAAVVTNTTSTTTDSKGNTINAEIGSGGFFEVNQDGGSTAAGAGLLTLTFELTPAA